MGVAIDAVRGMRDVLPDEQLTTSRVRAQLEAVLHEHGYQFVDLPLVEQRDLYLRKLGEELVGRIYEFNFGGRDLALRPEWTASVLRAYVASLQDQPLPLRLGYSGPVLRYERPQRLTYRQFTQVGGELIGGRSPRGDAEVLTLACAGLDAVGVEDYHVVVGHTGLVRDLLSRLGLAERTQGLLVWSMERLRSDGIEAVRQRINDTLGEPPLDPALLEGLDDEQTAALLLRSLQAMQVDLASGTRSAEEIVGRLLRKLRRGDPQPQIERALHLLERLCQIRGKPADVLPQLAALLAENDLETDAYAELQAVLGLLPTHGLLHDRLVIDFGLGRGLHYYTGMIFEIYDGNGMQLCGGGRYDSLVNALGSRQSVPAAGFAYGLERVVAAAVHRELVSRREVLVVPIADADYAYALDVAAQLRQRGFVVSVDVRNRNVASNLRHADRRGIPYVAIVGAEERNDQAIVWRDLRAREERRVALEALDM